VYRALTSKPVF